MIYKQTYSKSVSRNGGGGFINPGGLLIPFNGYMTGRGGATPRGGSPWAALFSTGLACPFPGLGWAALPPSLGCLVAPLRPERRCARFHSSDIAALVAIERGARDSYKLY